MITGWELYWILRLDTISAAFCILASALVIISTLVTMCTINHDIDFNWGTVLLILFTLFFGLGAVFIPNTKQAAAIYILPRIINNEKIQNIGNNALDTTNTLLELTQKYLSEQIKKGDK